MAFGALQFGSDLDEFAATCRAGWSRRLVALLIISLHEWLSFLISLTLAIISVAAIPFASRQTRDCGPVAAMGFAPGLIIFPRSRHSSALKSEETSPRS